MSVSLFGGIRKFVKSMNGVEENKFVKLDMSLSNYDILLINTNI